MPVTTRLARPEAALLAAYVAALRRDWSPDNVRGLVTTREHLAAIAADSDAFLGSLHDPDARGAPITLPDGSTRPRLPGYVRWIIDDTGNFCGSIGFRWRPGGSTLPDWVPGHIGYAVVPWQRRRGHATRALALMLEEARDLGLAHVDLTAEADNLPSHAVIIANGGTVVDRFNKPETIGGAETLRFRIMLKASAPRQSAQKISIQSHNHLVTL
ncbi:GNAT family N-acetyltransferase [Polymorphobacter arshaanensis]|uniref:GNAT family N-acetyltransferase n=1 Tax=Glacieibacterium arshaanense TaxID=2511025 RepID=A0A4Y9EMW6_9SPHN|nr:GNAT family N-acetyltransferase [Polymorphobacter arshaanensis]TFU03377.1 GNAT family N-acetyltransferase [Polymorphobacter arshaanensis]